MGGPRAAAAYASSPTASSSNDKRQRLDAAVHSLRKSTQFGANDKHKHEYPEGRADRANSNNGNEGNEGDGSLSEVPQRHALGDEELVTLLLADVKSSPLDAGKTKYGYSPLHTAVHFGHATIVKQLLAVSTSSGVASVDSQDGITPLDVAKELGHSELSQLLLDHVKKESGKEQIGNWLASIGMVECAANFQNAGFDDSAFLLANGLSDAALDAMRIEKPGHRMKLQGLYQLKESIPELNDDNEEEKSGNEDDDDEEESGSSDEDSDESGSEDSESEDDSDEGDNSE